MKMMFPTLSSSSVPPAPNNPGDDQTADSVVLERIPQKVKPPKMYQVVMVNDDYTPMEFVVVMLQEFFNKDLEAATRIMLKIHLDGRGICGVYTHDVASTKVNQVTESAQRCGHPLQCLCEPVE